MSRYTKSQTELGDIHAPVEDIDVPLALKLLVVLMLLILGGFTALIGMIVSQLP